MSTRITPPFNVNTKEIPNRTIKNNKSIEKGKRKSSHTNKLSKVQKSSKKNENSISDVKSSLREECLRLASFLRQETHRPGYVR